MYPDEDEEGDFVVKLAKLVSDSYDIKHYRPTHYIALMFVVGKL